MRHERTSGIDRVPARICPVVVAFSGGVDSAVVAAAAHQALGNRAVAVTAVSPSLASHLRETAGRVAREIGIAHRWLETDEVQDPNYIRNDSQRCFHCKSHLYQGLQQLPDFPGFTLVSGTNADDLGDYRPGLEAGRNAKVRTPLADLGFGKSTVRRLAHEFGLSVADAPAAPCLSSRIAYGVPVSEERLRRIDAAESWLRERGFATARVRLHPGEMARIEVPTERLVELVDPELRTELSDRFRELGFQFITLDVEGFRSGNLNQLVQIQPAIVPNHGW